MKKLLLAGLCLFVINGYGVFAQNKTLGVGVTTPNPNAALHVESPTGNQGFIMPRLTTAQRDAMASLLSSADIGLMLYDTEVRTIFIWNGASWESSSQFTIDNPANVDAAVEALTMGSGAAGRFTINNTASFAHALYAETNGDSTSAAIHGNHLGQGFGVFGKAAGSKFASAAVYGLHVGTGDAAGAFRISNTASTYSALFGETNGSGPAVYGNQVGLGRGGQFQITNTLNTQAAIRAYTAGTGNAGFYTINNVVNDSSALYSTTNGSGPAIAGLTTGTGPAAAFRSANTTSTAEALFVESYGAGRAATFRKTASSGAAPAVYIDAQGGGGIWADHNGDTGFAAIFQTINSTNTNAGVLAESIGSGPSVQALKSTDAISGDALNAENWIASGSAASFAITNPANTFPVISSRTSGSGPAIQAENNGSTDGFAGSFTITNSTNNFPAIQASTAGTGSGVRVMQNTGMGPGMDVFMQNTSSSAPGISVDQQGLGHAASFIVNNASNNLPGVQAITRGSGTALEAVTATGFTAVHAKHDGAMNGNAALIEITNSINAYPALQVNTAGTGFAVNARHTGTTGDAIYAEHAGAGNGSAGNFRISNPLNKASAVSATTSSADGIAVGVSNDANGLALAVWGGGMKVSTHTLSADGSITTRASAYLISGGASYTLGFTMSEGEIIYFFNSTTVSVTVDNTVIPANGGKTCIFLGGGLRAL